MLTRSDIFVILAMIFFISFLYSKYWSFNNNTNYDSFAQISITGSAPQKISLQSEKVHKFTGRIGYTSIQVKDNKIRFISSPCSKKYCIHSGWLSSVGSTAACMPNGIIISIKNYDTKFDSINF
ncbi:hypothetical protein MNBD_GAMMA22-332 [hydrothermal vent metagenome]|uniref:Uncharacterized protein n=1 Tax=hydrothermal vent metagenome TaxID=652676 RepID=A0A3B0ZL90_9ZZZZ